MLCRPVVVAGVIEQSSDVDPSGSDCDLQEIHISFAERFHNNITVLHIINIQYTLAATLSD